MCTIAFLSRYMQTTPNAAASFIAADRFFTATASSTFVDYRYRYDTTIYLRVLKSWRNGQLSLAHGTKNKEKLNTETD